MCNCRPYIPCNCGCPEETTNNGCPIQLDTDCVFYHLNSSDNSELNCTGFPNGSTLTDILIEFDTRLCAVNPFNFSSYNLVCLANAGYTITNFQEFAEAVSNEICVVRNEGLEITNSLTERLNTIDIDFACLSTPSTQSLENTLQKIVDDIIEEKVNLSPSDFNSTTTSCGTDFVLKRPQWVSSPLSVVYPTVQSHTNTSDKYLLDLFGNVRLTGQFIDVRDSKALETWVSTNLSAATGGFGYYIPIAIVPSAIAPTTGNALKTKGFVDAYIAFGENNLTFATSSTSPAGVSGYTTLDVSENETFTDDNGKVWLEQFRRNIICTLIKDTNNIWYFCVSKEYFPMGCNRLTGDLYQTSTVRIYLDGFTYNINN